MKAGTYYLCAKDSVANALSASAIALPEILRRINEVRPAQSNIIIDACEAAGLASDLNVILASPQFGANGTLSISLLATAAQDESASEGESHGLGSAAILDCIRGTTFVQDSSPALDLIEVARQVSERLSKGNEQTPVAFGLNLYGPPRFCRNPHFGLDPAASVRSLVQDWPTFDERIYLNLKDLFSRLEVDFSVVKFCDTLRPIIVSLTPFLGAVLSFVTSIFSAISLRTQHSSDAYLVAQVQGCVLNVLLAESTNSECRACLSLAHRMLCDELDKIHEEIISLSEKDTYALLRARTSAMADLYTMPLRISAILGWSALAACMRDLAGDEKPSLSLFKKIVHIALDAYQGAIIAMSDEQASSLLLVLHALVKFDESDRAEIMVGLMFSSLSAVNGNIAARDIDETKILDYLMMRSRNDFSAEDGLVARPTEVATVILAAGCRLDLADVLNDDLWQMDGVSLLAFFCNAPEKFADLLIDVGTNQLFQIGFDIFTVGDLEKSWPVHTDDIDKILLYSMACASLLYKERVVWQLLPEPTVEQAGNSF